MQMTYVCQYVLSFIKAYDTKIFDPGIMGLIPTAIHLKIHLTNFFPHTASVNPAPMGACWNKVWLSGW